MRLCALDGTFSCGETDDSCILTLFSTEKNLASLNTADAMFTIYRAFVLFQMYSVLYGALMSGLPLTSPATLSLVGEGPVAVEIFSNDSLDGGGTCCTGHCKVSCYDNSYSSGLEAMDLVGYCLPCS